MTKIKIVKQAFSYSPRVEEILVPKTCEEDCIRGTALCPYCKKYEVGVRGHKVHCTKPKSVDFIKRLVDGN